MTRIQIETKNESDMYLEYETFGDPKDPAFLLVMGLSVQVGSNKLSICNGNPN